MSFPDHAQVRALRDRLQRLADQAESLLFREDISDIGKQAAIQEMQSIGRQVEAIGQALQGEGDPVLAIDYRARL